MRNDDGTGLYTTGDLARLTGNTLRTVRYYEELGLLAPAPRRHGAHRLFGEKDLERLRTISDLRAVGLSLEQVAEVLNVHMHEMDGNARLAGAIALMDGQLNDLRERIATLQRVEKDLTVARDIMEKCKVCPDLGHPVHCTQCDNGRVAKASGLAGLLVRSDGEGPQA
ncbi:MAG: MerR family transcriptional regulator [Deltaproteobacteria bacterium]|nr:MerR family transcriptional regulator [Deltaproteobacteria bacterium]